jgi:ABC-type phosphate transport system substrate-binding protein
MKRVANSTATAQLAVKGGQPLLVLSVWLVMALMMVAWGGASADTHMRGPEFTDHRHLEEMPAGWKQQPIRYAKLPPGTDLAISLDQHLYPALLPLIRQYAQAHQLKVAVEEGTCGISAGALLEKEVDMAGFCCPAGETDRLPGLTYHTLGIASLALLVHPDNPVSNVTLQQAQHMYMGKIGNWKSIDPSFTENIQTIARLHCKNRPGHWRLILENEDMFSPTTREVSTIPDMLSLASSQRASLGYETLYMAGRHAGKEGIKPLSIDGASPEDNSAVIAGDYPFYRTYNITTWGDTRLRKVHAEQLLAYIYEHFDEVDPVYGLIPSKQLRQAGWNFEGNELVASPLQKVQHTH